MNIKIILIGVVLVALLAAGGFVLFPLNKTVKGYSDISQTAGDAAVTSTSTSGIKTALLGDGCFWCSQSDALKVAGVINVTSGYAGGTGNNPTYENYAKNGFREVIKVEYDPSKVSFANLVEHIIKHGDPTDPDGSFHDRGPQYAPAIYYQDDVEKQTALEVIKKADALKVFPKAISLTVIPTVPFWPAEEYHQKYAEKNPIRYHLYRGSSGRDAFIKKYWGDNTESFTFSNEISSNSGATASSAKVATTAGATVTTKYPWQSYKKPSDEVLRKQLSPLAYDVTQKSGTETPFKNEYAENTAEGIYVDVLSGEPLYSSKDKFDSGTGWPSFVKPITSDAVVLKEDRSLFTVRTEVLSRYAGSHTGHLFDDGPKERGGKRYCMNSAALRFIPKDKMSAQGYGDFLKYI